MRQWLFKIWVWFHVKLGLVTHQVKDDGAWAWGFLHSGSNDHVFVPVGRYLTLLDKHCYHNFELWLMDWGGRRIYIQADKCKSLSLKTKISFWFWMH